MTTQPMPSTTDPQQLLWWFQDRGRELSMDECIAACVSVGRNGAPGLLSWLSAHSLLSPEVTTACVAEAWSMAEYPERCLDQDDWRDLFELAGYTVDGKPAARPSHALVLWRGCPDSRRDGWSWTGDRAVAERFASGRHYRRDAGELWRAEVEPWRLFAHDNGRNECEYVVDTVGLDISTK